jgi:hypothetical protein
LADLFNLGGEVLLFITLLVPLLTILRCYII